MPIRALSFDVGGLLATGRSLTADLRDACDLPDQTVARCVRTRLHGAPEVTDEVIAAVAADLHLNPATVHRIVHNQGDLRIDPAARPALLALRRAFPDLLLVLNSNVCAAAAHQTAAVAEAFGDITDGYYRSYETGRVKGAHYQAFTQIAAEHRLNLDDIVHVGDKLADDVDAPLKAGCRAMLVNPHHTSLVEHPPAAADRYQSVATITEAATALASWIVDADDNNPRLAVRASMIIKDQDDNILIVTGPSDGGRYWLPGGRCHPYKRGHTPAATAMREIKEELDLTLHVTSDDVVNVDWSEGETRRDRSHKIVYTLDAGHVDRSELRITPNHNEIAAHQWVTRANAAALLDPAEESRLRAIENDELITFQRRSTP